MHLQGAKAVDACAAVDVAETAQLGGLTAESGLANGQARANVSKTRLVSN